MTKVGMEPTSRPSTIGTATLDVRGDEIVIEDLTYSYPGSTRPAIKDINLRVKKGEVLMVTGPSGAGKTTLCRCINGLIPHFFGGKMRGRVVTHSMVTTEYDLSTICFFAGTLFQDPSSQLVCPSVEAEISFGPENYGVDREEIKRRVKECIKVARLEGYEERSPHTLSGGEQQACAFAAVMAMQPTIYVLDEPTSELDPLGSSRMLSLAMSLAKAEAKTMVIVEHKMEDLANLVDRIVVIDKGEIILEGSPRTVLEEGAKIMEKIGLKPPQVTLLASTLKREGIELHTLPITLEEAVANFSKLLSESRKVAPSHKYTRAIPEEKKVIIETQGLWHIYPRGPTIALKDVDLKIYEGDFVAIIGQNGSGKTTLVKHFNGLLKPTKGKVIVDGIDTTKASTVDLSRIVGYCFQNPDHQILKRTVREELEFGPRNIGVPVEEIKERVMGAAKKTELEHLLDDNPFNLSKGERQRVSVASVLALKPKVLIVDEPTTGQDYKRSKGMMDLMRELNREGKTIIVITHDMNITAEYVERVILLKKGGILADGGVREIYSQPELLSETFLKPPQITRLSQMLEEYCFPKDVLTVEEMQHIMVNVLRGV